MCLSVNRLLIECQPLALHTIVQVDGQKDKALLKPKILSHFTGKSHLSSKKIQDKNVQMRHDLHYFLQRLYSSQLL